MKPNMQTIRWIIQLKIRSTQKYSQYKTNVATIIRYAKQTNRYAKQVTAPKIQCMLLGTRTLNLSYNRAFKVSNQIHWIFGVEILINQFSRWIDEKNQKKTLEVANISTIM